MRSLLSSALYLLAFFVLEGQDSWELVKDKEGIRIYTQNVDGSEFKAFRGVTELSTEIPTILAVLKNVEQHEDWMPYMLSSVLVLEKENAVIAYVISDAPWTMTNRDAYYEYQFQYDERASDCLVTIKALPNYGKENKEYVRIPRAKGYWKLSKLDNEKVKVMYEMHTDFGGSLQGWHTTSTLQSIAFRTLRRLEKVLSNSSGEDF